MLVARCLVRRTVNSAHNFCAFFVRTANIGLPRSAEFSSRPSKLRAIPVGNDRLSPSLAVPKHSRETLKYPKAMRQSAVISRRTKDDERSALIGQLSRPIRSQERDNPQANVGLSSAPARLKPNVASLKQFPGNMPKKAVPTRPCGIFKPQKFDFFLVLDLEATCDNPTQILPQEIIEFPCLKMNAKTLQIDSVFHQYIRPVAHPTLTPFCTELTGIIQEQILGWFYRNLFFYVSSFVETISGQPIFSEAMDRFAQWLQDERLGSEGNSFAFVSCGDWDLKVMLQQQYEQSGLPIPEHFTRWINLKKPFYDATRMWPMGMKHMFQILDLNLEGRLHSGIDDARNIARIVSHILANYGIVLDITSTLSVDRDYS